MDSKLARGKAERSFKEKVDRFGDIRPEQLRQWWELYSSRIRSLAEHPVIRDFVFEPVKGVFVVPGEGEVARVRGIITTVAVVNAVLAGLPGKMGIGVFVSMGLEIYMAWAIARALGLQIRETEDVTKILKASGIAAVTVFFVFKQVLSLAYTAIGLFTNWFAATNVVLAMAELVTTDFIGVLFLVGFKEIREGREFRVPVRTFKAIGAETILLLRHQKDLVAKIFSKENLETIKSRFGTWFRGEIPADMPRFRGELASVVAMSWLISEKFEHLDGPLGQEFISAIKDRFPQLQNASIEDISEHMATYDAEELAGVINLVKGKLFERLVARYENQDSDDWVAALHKDESWPGSDMILTNEQTGESIEISLKASSHPGYLEEALARYPDIPILATDEVAQSLTGNEMVIAAGLSNEEVTQVTGENFDRLLGELEPADVADVAAVGVAMKTTIGLWPFVVAHMKNRISQDQLSKACVAVLGDAGKSFASRLAYAAALGPIFAWWLLARGVMLIGRDQAVHPTSDSRLLVMP